MTRRGRTTVVPQSNAATLESGDVPDEAFANCGKVHVAGVEIAVRSFEPALV